MRRTLFIAVALTVVSFLLYCSKENLLGNNQPAESKDSVSITTNILFKQGQIQVSPDSVDSIRLTVTYGNVTLTNSFSFSAHHGTVAQIPVDIQFSLKIEGLDNTGTVIYSGTQIFDGFSDDASVTITASQVTSRAPSNLRLTAQTSTIIQVQWNDNSSNELGFIIERSQGNDSNYTVIDTGIPNQKALADDAGLLPATIYYYRVCAFNGAGKSAYLVEQAVQTPLQQRIDSIAPILFVSALPESVSVDSVTVTGKAHDSSGIYSITVNGQTATLSADSSFSAKIRLNLGKDTITVIATDNSSRKNDTTAKLYVIYDPTASDNTPPVVSFVSPINNDTVGSLSLTLTGTVNDLGSGVDSIKCLTGATVSLIGINWSVSVNLLTIGLNKITFMALDKRGNRIYDTLRVFADTTTLDTVKPVISFGGLTAGYMFTSTPAQITVHITENGSGLDTVYINGGVGTVSGSDWTRSVTLTPDSNRILVLAKDKAGNRGMDSVFVILNRTPQFTTLNSNLEAIAYLNQQYRDTVAATDPDGATSLTFTKQAGPSDMTVGITNGIITWTPIVITTIRCTVIVSDKYQESDTITWTINVLDTTPNISPSFIHDSTAMTATATIGSLYRDTVHATDSNNDALTFSLISNIVEMNLTDSIINWTPKIKDTGVKPIFIRVADGRGGYDTLSWGIHVLFNIDTIQLSWAPNRITVNPDSNQLWLSSWAGAAFVGIDLLADSIISVVPCLNYQDGPLGVCYSNYQGPKIYSSLRGNGRDGGSMALIELNTRPFPISKVIVNLNPIGCISHPTNGFIYTTHETAHNITEYSEAQARITRTINVGTETSDIKITKNGNKAYAVAQNVNQLKVISSSTFTISKSITLPAKPQNIFLDNQDLYGYVIYEDSRTITQFSLTSDQIVGQLIQVGNSLGFGTTSSDGEFAYVTDYQGNKIYKINISSKTIDDSLSVGVHPAEILFNNNKLIVVIEGNHQIIITDKF
ncbi:MAG: hypothetical protein A2268_00100 [Candidatus Raymondbacteria bacterium RifOxyA12_full_50_37]|uniref:Fibronectin type-III domain-containing protein n=1 Tax=Candidatus Raymondbacteria bacterium RIFOXYD12_FULL_49_13 TaxID=1817890 RepID=A0A1F7F2I5_UNCRA|nr:MAG: hypothetical protein A2268_00100 [Candidatus Raymondbacteria bacterium RifOxyA12_full_50_37]OGJ92721.1 MAG: hypothetical protein A2248_04150 [Candidatus Raymondbacteria bacterium RIFOXYA2_FULL_49_16]OGJ95928.1 MAG: hypothetical protein A2487_04525 [Candidatus Raymondbacteria bacterium RifOxyC12_full_50_8]OGK00747.1 MAG: hypothetical protein A2519_19970 [Candidatus Raymondbacteria bacterium RIFOXYD12_FULL_49_13]OGP44497.1 MAG: hypothetical protein A2324_09945 [Candidatus Raymondbacteria 